MLAARCLQRGACTGFCLRRFGYLDLSLASAIAFVCLALRWHPRLRGYFSVPPGIRDAPRGAGVAPVRGGTYSSLPRQRRVGRRKPLTPPALDLYPRALNVPVLHTATY
ncbi:hypothetical protein BN2476_1270016 [Paraburkholderia piptadeniae]|uniref:Uncharacterized protein n=1 Tax=Paraburkholderia piptadeniae TaxID=1701573 RepID=A0A1N7SW63_9BURK|nr:hypothetical protein BN2476_1270016 [Paraburkholderia piptadeniae]